MIHLVHYLGKVVRSMKQYEVLMAKELFRGSDIIRRFSYKVASAGDNYAHFYKRIVLYAAHHVEYRPAV